MLKWFAAPAKQHWKDSAGKLLQSLAQQDRNIRKPAEQSLSLEREIETGTVQPICAKRR